MNVDAQDHQIAAGHENRPSRKSWIGDITFVTYGVSIVVLVGAICTSTPAKYHTTAPPDPVVTHQLDCFVLRDISTSHSSADYDAIEDSIFSHLRTTAGDRVSYAVFGADTVPNPMTPPSTSWKTIKELRTLSKHTQESTDFARLFRSLRTTILEDRQAQLATRTPPHADAIVILSDGVPDLTNGSARCPQPNREFISDDIVEAFKKLTARTDYYATHEPIYVCLVLVGCQATCEPTIKEAWQRRLGGVAGSPDIFRVVSYNSYPIKQVSPSGKEQELRLDEDLFAQLRREPQLFLTLQSIDEDERSNFEHGQVFAVKYEARSFLQGGELHVKSGHIREIPEPLAGSEPNVEAAQGTLRVFQEPHLPPSEDNDVSIKVPPPQVTQLFGSPVVGYMNMHVDDLPKKLIPSKYSTYQLGLVSAATVKVEAPPLIFGPSAAVAGWRKAWRQVQRNVTLLRPFLVFLAVTFILGLLGWSMTLSSPDTRLHKALNKIFVEFDGWWLKTILIVLLPILLGRLISMKIAAIILILAVGVLLWLKRRLEKYLSFTGLATLEVLLAFAGHLFSGEMLG